MPRARRRMRRRRVATAAVGTAVVAGTAGAVHHHQNKRWAKQEAAAQQEYDQAYQEGAADAQAQQVGPAPEQYYEEPAAAPQDDLITQLERLGALRDQGILTEEEFADQKAKLLAM
jgi:hypothetical protein